MKTETPTNYGKHRPFWLPKGTPVVCGNYVGRNFQGWWYGCRYIRKLKDGYSKEYLIDWNGIEDRRVHHVRVDWKAIRLKLYPKDCVEYFYGRLYGEKKNCKCFRAIVGMVAINKKRERKI